MQRAVFLDRDGVLNRDAHLLRRREDVEIYPEVPGALRRLHDMGFLLIVATNQTVISRGLATEAEVMSLNRFIADEIVRNGGPLIRDFLVCPHHPKATLTEYRRVCECRKPRPGMLLRAAVEYRIDLTESVMVGDRLTDVWAGKAAGCSAVLVQTGAHAAPLIELADPVPAGTIPDPDHVCSGLSEAVEWIIQQRRG